MKLIDLKYILNQNDKLKSRNQNCHLQKIVCSMTINNYGH